MMRLRTNLHGSRESLAESATFASQGEKLVPTTSAVRSQAPFVIAGGHGGGDGDGGDGPLGGGDGGDIIYGGKACALFIFGDDSNRARRRVFNLWTHYKARKERAGFFKLKGALCLSKSQWRRFHGLG